MVAPLRPVLVTQQLLNNFKVIKKINRHVGSSSAVVGSPMKPETLARKIVPLQGEDYDEKNERLQRPLAPHLTIHKLQNNMVLSISHRFTGMILTSLTVGLASCEIFFFIFQRPFLKWSFNFRCITTGAFWALH